MSGLIRIGNVEIHVDENGRYCLNDLHRASGGKNRHRPSYFLQTRQAKEMVNLLSIAGNPAIKSKTKLGTFVKKELVYMYGMWVSTEFYLHVIQSYDAVTMDQHNKLEQSKERLRRAIVKDPNCLSVVFKQRHNKATHGLFKAMESLGLVRIVTESRPVYKKEITESGWRYCSGYSRDGVIRVKPEMHHELISLVKRSLDGCNMELFN